MPINADDHVVIPNITPIPDMVSIQEGDPQVGFSGESETMGGYGIHDVAYEAPLEEFEPAAIYATPATGPWHPVQHLNQSQSGRSAFPFHVLEDLELMQWMMGTRWSTGSFKKMPLAMVITSDVDPLCMQTEVSKSIAAIMGCSPIVFLKSRYDISDFGDTIDTMKVPQGAEDFAREVYPTTRREEPGQFLKTIRMKRFSAGKGTPGEEGYAPARGEAFSRLEQERDTWEARMIDRRQTDMKDMEPTG